jgi:hypothetical protein
LQGKKGTNFIAFFPMRAAHWKRGLKYDRLAVFLVLAFRVVFDVTLGIVSQNWGIGGPMSEEATVQYGEFQRGWPVLSACLIGAGLGLSPLPFYTKGVFAPHLAHEFGWTTGQIMGGLSITTLAVIVSGPAAGLLSQRYGTRQVALISALLSCPWLWSEIRSCNSICCGG